MGFWSGLPFLNESLQLGTGTDSDEKRSGRFLDHLEIGPAENGDEDVGPGKGPEELEENHDAAADPLLGVGVEKDLAFGEEGREADTDVVYRETLEEGGEREAALERGLQDREAVLQTVQIFLILCSGR